MKAATSLRGITSVIEATGCRSCRLTAVGILHDRSPESLKAIN